MAQSVKLKDGSYIDASGVYDTTQGKTQETLNNYIPANKITWRNNVVTNIDSNDYGTFHIINNNNITGTLPTGIGGNTFQVIQLFADSEITYNAQLAFGFGSDKIALRRKVNSTTWGDWKYLTFS